jgi:hypothetical protein
MSQERKLFEAQILFDNPDIVPAATRTLARAGFRFMVDPTMIDECSNAVFGLASCVSGIDEGELHRQLVRILAPFGGDCFFEWGYARQGRGNVS